MPAATLVAMYDGPVGVHLVGAFEVLMTDVEVVLADRSQLSAASGIHRPALAEQLLHRGRTVVASAGLAVDQPPLPMLALTERHHVSE